jgi:hypothetical protein
MNPNFIDFLTGWYRHSYRRSHCAEEPQDDLLLGQAGQDQIFAIARRPRLDLLQFVVPAAIEERPFRARMSLGEPV